jgi:hypothetical protein
MAGADLDHEEYVDAAQDDCAVDVEEVLCQHRRGLDAQELPPSRTAALRRGRDPLPWEQPGQGGEHPPGRPGPASAGVLPPQRRDLLAQHQQLGILRRRGTCQQHHPADQADEHQVQHPYRHKPAMMPAARPAPLVNLQVSGFACCGTAHRFGTPQALRTVRTSHCDDVDGSGHGDAEPGHRARAPEAGPAS